MSRVRTLIRQQFKKDLDLNRPNNKKKDDGATLPLKSSKILKNLENTGGVICRNCGVISQHCGVIVRRPFLDVFFSQEHVILLVILAPNNELRDSHSWVRDSQSQHNEFGERSLVQGNVGRKG